MNRNGFLCALILSAAVPVVNVSGAVVTSLTAYPNSASNVVGNGSAAPGFSSSSWQSSAVGVGQKSEFYAPSSSLFPSKTVHLSDIASISYWTNKPGASTDPDWSFIVYTAPTGSGDTGSFYHTRLNSEPYLTNTPTGSDPASAWHVWSTNDANNPMRFYDTGRDGGIAGTYTDPTLVNLLAGPVNWKSYNNVYANNTYDYTTASDTVLYFSLQTGNPWGNGFTGLVDGMTVTLTNGDVGVVNLEVPEPGSLSVLSLLGVGFIRRRRR